MKKFINLIPENLRNKPGIYVIRNTVNGKVYIGQAKSLGRRVSEHQSNQKNPHLKAAVQKYGHDKFEVSCAIVCEVEDLTRYEAAILAMHGGYDSEKTYNIIPADEPASRSAEWRKANREARQKLSQDPKWREAMNKRSQNPKWREAQRAAMKKRSQDPNWREANREAMNKLSQDPKWREAQRAAMKKRSQDPKWLAATRAAMKKRSLSFEYLAPGATEWQAGRNLSEFARENNLPQSNISECLSGKRPHTKGYKFRRLTEDESTVQPTPPAQP